MTVQSHGPLLKVVAQWAGHEKWELPKNVQSILSSYISGAKEFVPSQQDTGSRFLLQTCQVLSSSFPVAEVTASAT